MRRRLMTGGVVSGVNERNNVKANGHRRNVAVTVMRGGEQQYAHRPTRRYHYTVWRSWRNGGEISTQSGVMTWRQ